MSTEQGLVLITGGSRGIGRACAKMAASKGYRVAITYAKRADTAKQAIANIGRSPIALQADISREADILDVFTTLDREEQPLVGLINNAGVLDRQTQLADMTGPRIARILDVNVLGTLICTREAVRRMSTARGGKGGVIVSISSMASRLGSPNEYIDYAASKGAVDTMTIGLAKEVAAEGIRVNGVRPGLIYTEMHADGGEAGRVDRLKTTVPMLRGGEAEEVAEAAVWLLSESASYVTGSFIDVAGGR